MSAFADVSNLYERHDIDVAVLALHPEVSVFIAIDFLKKGKSILDEKPLAVDLAQTKALGEAVSGALGIYQIGFVFRYSSFALEVKRLLKKLEYLVLASLRSLMKASTRQSRTTRSDYSISSGPAVPSTMKAPIFLIL